MKKNMLFAVVAAAAMVMVMVGCNVEVTFSEQTLDFDNTKILNGTSGQKSVYPVESWTFLSGSDVIEITASSSVVTGTNIPSLVTIKSKSEGTAKVTFTCSTYAKEATAVEITVGSTGSISGYYPLQEYQWQRSSSNVPDPTRGWMDAPATNPFSMKKGLAMNTTDSLHKAYNAEVNGNIVYLLHYDSAYDTMYIYDYVRFIISKDSNGKCVIDYDTEGCVSVIKSTLERKYWGETVCTTLPSWFEDWTDSVIEYSGLMGDDGGFTLTGGDCDGQTYEY